MEKGDRPIRAGKIAGDEALRGEATKREISAWCLYDFANSSYTTIIITVAYSVYFTNIVAPDGGERLWGWGYSASMLIVALISPYLGALSDAGGYKRRFLTAFTLICVISTSLLYFVEGGMVLLGLSLLIVSNVGFSGGMHFYNSFLIDISTKDNIGRISGYGWGVGYIGGLISLLIVFPFIKGGFTEENLLSYRTSFLVTGLFFLVASLPTLLMLKERRYKSGLAPGKVGGYGREAVTRLKVTFQEIRRFKELLKYFAAYLIYTDGINTIIVFSGIYANKVLGFTPVDLIIFFIVMQISSALGALILGPLSDKIGQKRTIDITLIVWILVSIGAYLVETKAEFYMIGLVAGAGLGANQSVSRSLLGLFTPHGKNGEFFGFFATVGKFAAVFGPIIYSEVASITGSQRGAVLALSLFFIVGLIVLQSVDEEGGIEGAKNFEADKGVELNGTQR